MNYQQLSSFLTKTAHLPAGIVTKLLSKTDIHCPVAVAMVTNQVVHPRHTLYKHPYLNGTGCMTIVDLDLVVSPYFCSWSLTSQSFTYAYSPIS